MRRVYDEIAEEKLPQRKTESAFKSETENADTGRAGSHRAGWKNAD